METKPRQTGTRKPRPLPAGWRWARLGNVIAEAQPGFACGARDPNGVIQLRMNNVDTRGNIVWDQYIRVPADGNTVDTYRLLPGDVVFNNTNSTELVGKSALFAGHDEPVVYSNHFTRLRADSGHLEPRYLVAWLRHQWESGVFERLCMRWVGQSAVKSDKLLTLHIPLPPLPEQSSVASRLESQMAEVARMRRAAERQRVAVGRMKEACLRALFDSATSRDWPRRPLAALLREPLKNGLSPRADEAGEYRCLTLSAVRDATILPHVSKLVALSKEHARPCVLRQGDIFLIRGNGTKSLVGAPGRCEEDQPRVIYPDLLIRVRLIREMVDSDFFLAAWQSSVVREQVEDVARTAAGIWKVSQEKLNGVLVPTPTLEEQREVAGRAKHASSQVSALFAAATRQLAALDALPGALLHEVFGGFEGEEENASQ